MAKDLLTREQLDKIEETFHLAQYLASSEFDDFIVQQSAGDEAVLRILRELLKTNASNYTIDPPKLQSTRERIGKYKIEREIGEGGYGKVYLASYDVEDVYVRVAIKLLNLSIDKYMSDRFIQERQILAELSHPNIASLMDGGVTEDGIPFIVMEYVEGVPIDKYCDDKRLTIEERLNLFLQLCKAVNYIHQRQIVHRDLKPANVLVTKEGVVKLLDFGIAKLLGGLGRVAVLAKTRPGDRMLTWMYASPEQVTSKQIDIRSDIYSLGVILYELLTGHSPYLFQQRLREKIDDVISNVPPVPPSEVIELVEEVKDTEGKTIRVISPNTVSTSRRTSSWRLRHRLMGDVDLIVLKMLDKNPALRYGTCYGLSEDISRFLCGLPVNARKQTKLYLLRKWVGRHKVITVLIAAFLFVFIYPAHLHGKQYEKFVDAEEKFFNARDKVLMLMGDESPAFYEYIGKCPQPSSVESDMVLAHIHFLSEAENLANSCLEWHHIVKAYSRLGQYLAQCGENQLAEEYFQKARRINQSITDCL